MSAGTIEAREATAARALGTTGNVHLPIPNAGTKAALEAKGVVFGKPIDSVLISATLPDGWSIKRGPAFDERKRVLLSETGGKVADIFIKNSGYDYYGSIGMA